MPPPFWIHCNICNTLFSKETKHYLLSCTHIFCQTCMKCTNGKICPICKRDIKFEDMSNLPDELKKNFQPNIKNLLYEPARILSFQQNHLRNMAKLTRDYKTKSKHAMEVYEKEKSEVLKLKNQLDTYTKQRRMMQEKLKEIYMRNKAKRQHEIYRNPTNSTMSSQFSSEKIRSSVNSVSTKEANSGFFNQTSQMGQNNFSTGSSDFFDGRRTLMNKRLKKIDHTQSDRTPFFA